MPTSLCEISHPKKISVIRVSPKTTHKSEIRVSPAAHATPTHAHKSGDSCEEKGSEDGWVPPPSEPFLEKNYCYLL